MQTELNRHKSHLVPFVPVHLVGLEHPYGLADLKRDLHIDRDTLSVTRPSTGVERARSRAMHMSITGLTSSEFSACDARDAAKEVQAVSQTATLRGPLPSQIPRLTTNWKLPKTTNKASGAAAIARATRREHSRRLRRRGSPAYEARRLG
jgi:hypothetical protein